MGRISVDFVAAADAEGPWRVYALEVNRRKGGTTHPYAVLRNLVPGRYDATAARWVTADGGTRVYVAEDSMLDPAWTGLPARVVIDAVRGAGLQFDAATGIGVVLSMLSGLAIDGRFGAMVITDTPERAEAMLAQVRDAMPLVRCVIRSRDGTDCASPIAKSDWS